MRKLLTVVEDGLTILATVVLTVVLLALFAVLALVQVVTSGFATTPTQIADRHRRKKHPGEKRPLSEIFNAVGGIMFEQYSGGGRVVCRGDVCREEANAERVVRLAKVSKDLERAEQELLNDPGNWRLQKKCKDLEFRKQSLSYVITEVVV